MGKTIDLHIQDEIDQALHENGLKWDNVTITLCGDCTIVITEIEETNKG